MSEREWELDKRRFVDDARLGERRSGRSTRGPGSYLGPLARQFATLTCALLDARTIEDVLSQVVAAAAGVIPEADLISVTVRAADGTFHTPAHNDGPAVELDKLQYEASEGPCVCAAMKDGPALAESPDLALDTQWPTYSPRAVELGVRSVLALTMPMPHGRPAGALNLFSRTPHGLDTVDRSVVLLLATHASLALAATDAVTQADLRAVDLKRAIDSRDVIGQAKGIIMARKGVDAADAFDILRKASMDLNVKLVKLAETVATRHDELDLASP